MRFWGLLLLISAGCRGDPAPPPEPEKPVTSAPFPAPEAVVIEVKEPVLPKIIKAETFLELSFAGLKVHERGVPLSEARQVVILFHGYGAEGDDLVSLASPLASAGTAFVFPEAPCRC